jgi:hypothetical protein
MSNALEVLVKNRTIRQVVLVRDISQSEAAEQWLQEQGGERFVGRAVTPVHDKSYLYWNERNADNVLQLWIGFYEDKFAMMFKLAFGKGSYAG